MISDDFLRILRCPATQQPLKIADEGLVARANARIAAAEAVNRLGETIQRTLDGGLVNESETLLYAIYDEIPCLLVDEAMELDRNRLR